MKLLLLITVFFFISIGSSCAKQQVYVNTGKGNIAYKRANDVELKKNEAITDMKLNTEVSGIKKTIHNKDHKQDITQ